MEEIATRELYSQLQERLIINLDKDEILCPDCKGLKFVFIEQNQKGYIESCRRCYTGKLFVCKYCEKGYKSQCDCKEANEERRSDWDEKKAKKEFEAYQKAEKINYKDYTGYYILQDGEQLKDLDDVSEWIYEKLTEGEDVSEYLWAVEGTPHFSIDLTDVIYDKCEDGYDDMYDYLDTKSPLLSQAQELVNQWEKEQGESLFIFNETYKKAVIIKDLIEEIKQEIKKESVS